MFYLHDLFSSIFAVNMTSFIIQCFSLQTTHSYELVYLILFIPICTVNVFELL